MRIMSDKKSTMLAWLAEKRPDQERGGKMKANLIDTRKKTASFCGIGVHITRSNTSKDKREFLNWFVLK